MATHEGFSNWSGNRRHPGARVHAPDSAEAVATLVTRARAAGRKVRCRGTAHSFADLWTDDDVVSLDAIAGVRSTDIEARTATIAAGTKLHALGEPLWRAGLSLPQQGDVDQQSIGGALGTGTHGTGPTLGSLSTAVRAATLVNGLGESVTCDADSDAALLQAAQLSLGMLGILTEVTLELTEAYRLREWHSQTTVGDCGERLTGLIADSRHFEFFWTPRHEVQGPEAGCLLKTLNIAADDEADSEEADARVGPAYRVFPTHRELRFNEMEYTVAAEDGWACFSALREMMLRDHPKLPWPVEYRTLAADALPLSPTAGRPSVTLSVHQGADRDYRELFEASEAVFREFDGRPHWGKVHFLDHARVRALYPRLGEFNDARERMDPDGLFLTDAMARLLAG